MSGTATEGTDYNDGSTVSDITISAGNLFGTATLTPKNDDEYEFNSGAGSETAIVNITVSGGGATESGSQTVTITITNEALDSGTQNTYNSSSYRTSSQWLNQLEFYYSGLDDTKSYTINGVLETSAGGHDPYRTINLHKALAYSNGSGLMLGSGEVIAIMDTGFQVNGLGSNTTTHQEFSGTTITNYNSSNF